MTRHLVRAARLRARQLDAERVRHGSLGGGATWSTVYTSGHQGGQYRSGTVVRHASWCVRGPETDE